MDRHGNLYWVEGRPNESVRYVIVKCDSLKQKKDIISKNFNARSTVHEYGGLSFFRFNGPPFKV